MKKYLLTLASFLIVLGGPSVLKAAEDSNTPIDSNTPVDNNTPVIPIANAGPDQTVFADFNDTAVVTLDGSDSNCPDDANIIDYKWTWEIDGQPYEANGVSPEITLPVVDGNVITISLIVTCDSNQVSAPDTVDIEILSSLNARMKFTPQALNLKAKGKWVLAHFRLPAGYYGRDVNTIETIFLEPYGIPAQKLFSLKTNNPNFVVAFSRNAVNRALTAVQGNRTTIIVSGQLKDGQSFVGTDQIKLIKPKAKAPKKPKKK